LSVLKLIVKRFALKLGYAIWSRWLSFFVFLFLLGLIMHLLSSYECPVRRALGFPLSQYKGNGCIALEVLGAKVEKISRMEVMIESLHHVVNQLAGVLLTLWGEVEIEPGGFELSMAHVALDDAQVDACFEEVGRIGMAQSMDRNAFFAHAGIPFGAAQGALDATFGHGVERLFGASATAAKSWEEQTGMAVGAPILA
jgi:hypothetical protein